jgi:Na+/H+-dicarboxylate symporter
MWKLFDTYKSSFILLFSMIFGGVLGIYAPEFASKFEPIGKIFLNLLFVVIVPLVAVSVTSSISSMTDLKSLGRILVIVLIIAVVMALIPAIGMVGLAAIFDPAQGVKMAIPSHFTGGDGSMDFVSMVSANDFVGLLSKSHILPLIIVCVITGIAIGQSGARGKKTAELLDSLNAVIMRVVAIIMKIAPVGLGCYFASTMASQDPQLLVTFARVTALFFGGSLIYYVFGSSFYAWIAGGLPAVRAFWRHAIEPSATALGTCSSLATLPVSIRAAKSMGVKSDVVDIALPLLVNVNKGGVAMIAALKVVFIFSVLGLHFSPETFLMTMVIAVLSAIIVGGVPGGAFLGEIFIVTTLKLPLETIPMLVVIGTITDAPATLINVVHNINAVQIVERFTGKRVKTLDPALSSES